MNSKLRDSKIYLLDALLVTVNRKKIGKYLSSYSTDTTVPSKSFYHNLFLVYRGIPISHSTEFNLFCFQFSVLIQDSA